MTIWLGWVERRDQLALRRIRGETLTPAEIVELDDMDTELNTMLSSPNPLPDDVIRAMGAVEALVAAEERYNNVDLTKNERVFVRALRRFGVTVDCYEDKTTLQRTFVIYVLDDGTPAAVTKMFCVWFPGGLDATVGAIDNPTGAFLLAHGWAKRLGVDVDEDPVAAWDKWYSENNQGWSEVEDVEAELGRR